jgi:hypothetical protein
MQPKTLFLFVFAFCYFLTTKGQRPSYYKLERPTVDADLQRKLKDVPISENQYFDLQANNRIVFITVVPEIFLSNKDSLMVDSRHWYERLKTAIGPERANAYISIIYMGRLTDAHNRYFSYKNDVFAGEVPLIENADTMLPPAALIRKFENLDSNKYIRQRRNRNGGMDIVFYTIVSNTSLEGIKGYAEKHWLRYLIDFLGSNFRLYDRISIIYTNRYCLDDNVLCTNLVNEGVLYYLDQFVNGKIK